MRRLCFGGSFNPIHHGHLIVCRAAAEAAGFDRVVLIPSAQPPHKESVNGMVPVAARLALCGLAVEGDPLFEVSTAEADRDGPSYTSNTARLLRRAWGERVSWLVGADAVANLPRWHAAAELAAEVDFVAVARPGWPLDVPPGWSVTAVVAPLIDLSSTAIRERVAAGRSIRFLVPSAVEQYIADHGLYRTPT